MRTAAFSRASLARRVATPGFRREMERSASLHRSAPLRSRSNESAVKAIDSALDAFQGENPFDLMVTDLRMPAMSGVEVVEILRERGIPLHVLTMSSLCRKGILCTMDCSCGTNHLGKPFQPRDLVERVGKILDRKGSDTA